MFIINLYFNFFILEIQTESQQRIYRNNVVLEAVLRLSVVFSIEMYLIVFYDFSNQNSPLRNYKDNKI